MKFPPEKKKKSSDGQEQIIEIIDHQFIKTGNGDQILYVVNAIKDKKKFYMNISS